MYNKISACNFVVVTCNVAPQDTLCMHVTYCLLTKLNQGHSIPRRCCPFHFASLESFNLRLNVLDFKHESDVLPVEDGDVLLEGKRLGVDESELVETHENGATLGHARLTTTEHAQITAHLQ